MITWCDWQHLAAPIALHWKFCSNIPSKALTANTVTKAYKNCMPCRYAQLLYFKQVQRPLILHAMTRKPWGGFLRSSSYPPVKLQANGNGALFLQAKEAVLGSLNFVSAKQLAYSPTTTDYCTLSSLLCSKSISLPTCTKFCAPSYVPKNNLIQCLATDSIANKH